MTEISLIVKLNNQFNNSTTTVCRQILGCVDRISVKFVYIFTSKTLNLHFLIRIKVGPGQLFVFYAFVVLYTICAVCS